MSLKIELKNTYDYGDDKMDFFNERIITKKKDYVDYLIILGTIVVSFIAAFLIISIAGPIYFGIGLALVAALGYAGYIVITGRNIEYEYSLTSGDLEISKIISKRKRKRIFSGSCRQFEIIDKASSDRHNISANNVISKIRAVSSMSSEDAYFFITHYNNNKVVVYFEPDSEILNIIRTFNRKAFS